MNGRPSESIVGDGRPPPPSVPLGKPAVAHEHVFRAWFMSLMTMFIVINLLGFVCGFGEAKRVTAGFPCLIAEWIRIGEYRESNYFPSAIVPNAVVALLVSLSLAYVCALSHRKRSGPSHGNGAPSDEKQEHEGPEMRRTGMD